MKGRPGGCPYDNDYNCNRESPWAAENIGGLSRKDMKCIVNATDQAVVAFVLRLIVSLLLFDNTLRSRFDQELRA